MKTEGYVRFERLLRKRKNISSFRIATILQRVRNTRYVAGIVEIARKEGKKPQSIKSFVKKVDDAAKTTEPGPLWSVIRAAAAKLIGESLLPEANAFDNFSERIDAIIKKQGDVRVAIHRKLLDLANELPPRVVMDGEPRLVSVFRDWLFSSQPGKIQYTTASAKIQAKLFQAIGVPAEVVTKNEDGEGFTAEVWARVQSELDVEILQRRFWPMAELVRLCWAHGVNPRVNSMGGGPFLPHDFEDKVGIDCFGRVVDREKYAAACLNRLPEFIGVGPEGRFRTLAEIQAFTA